MIYTFFSWDSEGIAVFPVVDNEMPLQRKCVENNSFKIFEETTALWATHGPPCQSVNLGGGGLGLDSTLGCPSVCHRGDYDRVFLRAVLSTSAFILAGGAAIS